MNVVMIVHPLFVDVNCRIVMKNMYIQIRADSVLSFYLVSFKY
jgi:hypothetical protein